MQLLEIQRGYIKVGVHERTVTIGGEGFLRLLSHTAFPTQHVDYVVYPNTLTHWDKPWENEPLPAETQAAVLTFLKEEFRRRGQVLAVE